MNRLKGLLLIFVTLVVSLSSCSTSGPPDIKVKWPKLFRSNYSKDTGSAFMAIINDGTGKDILTGCSVIEYPEVSCELHNIVNGRMVLVKQMEVPAKGILDLKSGSSHLMFFGLPDKMKSEITVVLRFRKSGTMKIKTKIKWF
ncbi:hypothetical protein BMS3Abin07_00609 [bacterium BMS3Abin07]|nr:hypothetical protein BMS3Abin07_00609 [bacterium BMS3Abin07]GBE31275.1 hypothetical protein BMS3Bbin05_00174 [bacterium BMS3Bbin05]HDO23591.1 copper chaperone PCu(A)C [Nitrospirota bacterium]HDZ88887.1 copper chaperone PCu(A)C [Nitrospirota bacterium]